jgi:hypothetical protein
MTVVPLLCCSLVVITVKTVIRLQVGLAAGARIFFAWVRIELVGHPRLPIKTTGFTRLPLLTAK